MKPEKDTPKQSIIVENMDGGYAPPPLAKAPPSAQPMKDREIPQDGKRFPVTDGYTPPRQPAVPPPTKPHTLPPAKPGDKK